MRADREISNDEEKQLVRWIKAGFKRFSDDDPCNTEIAEYGNEFVRLVQTNKLRLVRVDLLDLMKACCPALALVELMFVCTGGVYFTIAGGLQANGVTDTVLSCLKKDLEGLAHAISVLTDRNFHGPLVRLKKHVPLKRKRRHIRRSLAATPGALRYLGEALKDYVLEDHPGIDEHMNRWFLLVFYLMLAHFGRGDETLSLLLETMRSVRQTTSTKYEQLSGSLGREALQRRILRFCDDYPVARMYADMFVTSYMAIAIQQPDRQSVLDWFVRNQGNVEEEHAEALCKSLKLTKKQKSAVLGILIEHLEKVARSLIAMATTRRTKEQILLNVLSAHKKLTELSQHRDYRIRDILDAAQSLEF